MTRARILLADDHLLTLEGIRAILEPHHEIVGAVADGRAAVDEAVRLRPDLAVLDITMPLLNGIDAARQIRKRLPGTKILFVTMHVNPAYLEAAMATGAAGYVLKSAAREELLKAVAVVLAGRRYITPSLALDSADIAPSSASPSSNRRLSNRQREILQLVAEGKAAKEIAHILQISVKTVAFHRDNIKRKLGIRTVAELTRYALEQGLV